MFKKALFFVLFIFLPVSAETINGNVRQDDLLNKKSVIVDSQTEKPIEGAKVYLPDYNFKTKTDKNGQFQLNASIEDSAILQIEKEGYRPFSMIIDKSFQNHPLKLGIEKTNNMDAFIEQGVFHLGDNNFSSNSANCREFKADTLGPYYSKTISLNVPDKSKQAVIIFGSVIGLDTKSAKELRQNSIISAYSSPAEVIFNGEKIGELNVNGDNQQIIIPNSLIRPKNELIVKTGKNLFQYKYTDYDDMEFANLRIELQDKVFARR